MASAPRVSEVLTKKNLPPLSLYNFYIYIRDEENAIEFLDLFLDIMLHKFLFREHIRGLYKAGVTSTSLNTESSSTLGPHHFTRFRSASLSLEDLSTVYWPNFGPLLLEELSNEQTINSSDLLLSKDRAAYLKNLLTSNIQSLTQESTVISKEQVKMFTQIIIEKYFNPASPHEVMLPPQLVQPILDCKEHQRQDELRLFEDVETYLLNFLLKPAYYRFLNHKFKHNLNPLTCTGRFIIGYVSTFAAYWLGFCGIFLDYSRRKRVWTLLPFAFGFYNLICTWSKHDPVLALLGYSEVKPFHYEKVLQPSIRLSLNRRAIFVLSIIVLIVGANTAIFSCVPSIRL
ncbi:Protein rax1 [Schizosaccharomyces pombe]|uniref:Protein rax1 n=1 Tax=Schizosaccharomyces pombe (strain 972 / ATCC 24843) TaxID=284812 RepID=RAX1_SCHPO|nr:putative RGS domain-containing family protein [Schizosaccharomyces pombe]Q9P7S8.1 RecName: Full=Protein rax1 [Schizosaccharomyces pombe 972h-]CAB72230.1 regulator of G-protein signaling (RGS) domain (predicted) [Schizosaccharomyces pombe]|eukprot:NP_593105.1 putative RGS domain-containing family protein [Schizosaccharomyces pombe]